MIAGLLADLRATTALEAIAVLLGLLYVTLIVRRRRAGWIAGALSSAIYVYLAYAARLPMQALLQAYPKTIREQSQTEELCRLLLPFAWLYYATGKQEYRQMLYTVTRDLEKMRHPSGAYLEWLEKNYTGRNA